MTKTQFKKKIASMKKDINQYIDKETMRLFESGGVDTAKYKDNYLLPKTILNVTLSSLADQYCPYFDKNAREDAKNLEHF